MAQAPKYNRGYPFEDYQTANPTAPLPGVNVDQELDSVANSLNQNIDNLGLIQSDDGGIKEAVVDEDALTPEVRDKLNSGGGNGGGGAVNSVNGQQGDVSLTTNEIPPTSLRPYYNVSDAEKVATVETGAQRNLRIATQAEAEAGVNNTFTMTPLRTKEAIDAQVNAIPDFTYATRDFDLTPIFNANVTYNPYTMTGVTNVNYGLPDSTWINGAEQFVSITGNGDFLTWDAEYVEDETLINGDIPTPANGETINYRLRWSSAGQVLVGPQSRYLRRDGQSPMRAPLDMAGFDLQNVGAASFNGAALSIPQNINYAASIQLNLAAANMFVIGALTGNLTLSNPQSDDAGRGGTVYLDNRGGHTVTMGTNWSILNGQSQVVPAKEVLLPFSVPYPGKIAYSIEELN